ncbi:MAG TPA: hypothetical protein VJ770_04435 [Stellaceae bacterium]|nr:hypothetical protein [Stellaceae bacterium]
MTAARRFAILAFRLLITAGLLRTLASRLDMARAEDIADHISLAAPGRGLCGVVCRGSGQHLRWLSLYPGTVMFLAGVLTMAWLPPGTRTIGGTGFDIHTLLMPPLR